MTALARACALALLAAGCFVDIGLPGDTFPAPTTAASSSTSTTDPTTTGSTGDVTAGSTSSTSTSTATTTTTTDETTAAPICGVAGKACDDAAPCCGCLACVDGQCSDSDACGPCRSCTAIGACQPTPDLPCDAAASDDCTSTIWGVDGDSCHAGEYAVGVCDESGACVVSQCDGKGEPIAVCIDEACVDPSACVPGDPVDALGAFCVDKGQTPGCADECDDFGDFALLTFRQCGPGGNCKTGLTIGCGNYRCDGAQACKTECADNNDCITGAVCWLGMCIVD